jgi:hypothetical protein
MKMNLGEELLKHAERILASKTVFCPNESSVCLSVSEVYCPPEKRTITGVNTNALHVAY